MYVLMSYILYARVLVVAYIVLKRKSVTLNIQDMISYQLQTFLMEMFLVSAKAFNYDRCNVLIFSCC